MSKQNYLTTKSYLLSPESGTHRRNRVAWKASSFKTATEAGRWCGRGVIKCHKSSPTTIQSPYFELNIFSVVVNFWDSMKLDSESLYLFFFPMERWALWVPFWAIFPQRLFLSSTWPVKLLPFVNGFVYGLGNASHPPLAVPEWIQSSTCYSLPNS